MSSSPGAKFTAGGFKAIEGSLDSVRKKAQKATDSIKEMFDVGATGSHAFTQAMADYTIILHDLARSAGLATAALRDVDRAAASAAKRIGKVVAGMRRAGMRMGGGGAGRGDGGGGGGAAAAGGEEGDGGDDKRMLAYRRSFIKFSRREADWAARQREKEANLTHKLMQKARKDQEAAAKAAAKEWQKTVVPLSRVQSSAIDLANRIPKKAKEAKAATKAAAATEKAVKSPFERAVDRLHQMSLHRFKNYMAFQTLMRGTGGALRESFGRAGGAFGLSRYAPGSMGIAGRYRMFQKPFPGSDRNIFNLGDVAAAGQNIAYGAGSYLENSFRALTSSATAVNRAFSGIVVGGVSMVDPFLGSLLGSISDAFLGMFEKLSSAVAGVIGTLTRLSTALIGFATRAVEAASDLTEAINAARVIAGPGASAEMLRYATQLQREYGLSVTDAMKAMGRMAGMMRNLGGFSQEEAGFTSSRLYRYAVDIGSVVNKSAEEVGMAMMSGFAGRLTPLRRYMIGMQAPQLDAMAKARGMTRPGMRVDYEARIRQFVEEFARQGGLFIGDLERTRWEFANQRRRLLGQFEALFVSIGKILEPFAKTVLFAANDLMSGLLDFLDQWVNPMTLPPVVAQQTIFQKFQPAIEAFVYYALYARNAITAFAKAIYESRGAIGQWIAKAATTFVSVLATLTQYSVNVLMLFADLVDALGGVTGALSAFQWSLGHLSGLIDRITGNTPYGKVDQLRKDVLSRRDQMFQESLSLRSTDPERSKALGRDSMALFMFAARMEKLLKTGTEEQLKQFYDKNVGASSSPLGAISDGLRAAASKAQQGSAGIRGAAKQLDDLLKSMGITVDPFERGEYVRRLEGAMSMPNAVAPQMQPLTGRMVQYFNPAAFRDSIQERDMSSALMRTANASEKTNDLLQMLVDGAFTVKPSGPILPIPLVTQ